MADKTGKTLIEYNIKNCVYSVDGTTVKPLTWATEIALEKSIDTKEIYGDGELQLSILNDKGMTGTLGLTAKDDDFDADLGFSMAITDSVAEVSIVQNKSISIGAEFYYTGNDGITKVKKKWYYGVNVSPSGETYSQNTDTINENAASYPLIIKGVALKDSTGSSDYVDENGLVRKAFSQSSVTGDVGFATFLETVPVPKAKAVAQG